MKKIKVAILVGGFSDEYNVSIAGGQNIKDNLDTELFDYDLIEINKDNIKGIIRSGVLENYDFIYNNIHGVNGEDGAIQGYCQLIRVPYIGTGIATSALSLDKGLTAAVFSSILPGMSLPTYNLTLTEDNFSSLENYYHSLLHELGSEEFIIKPYNGGSSNGITIIKSYKELLSYVSTYKNCSYQFVIEPVLKDFLEFSTFVFINSNDNFFISDINIVNESVPYTYERKYINGTFKKYVLEDTELISKIKRSISKLVDYLHYTGYVRIDGFILNNGKIFFNDPNTITGMLNTSLLFNSLKTYLTEFNCSDTTPKTGLSMLIANSLEGRLSEFCFDNEKIKIMLDLIYHKIYVESKN